MPPHRSRAYPLPARVTLAILPVFALALSAPSPALPQGIAPIVANVELVNMVFTVEDGQHNFVSGLEASDFRVLENKRPQTIQYFSEDANTPLTLGLLIDDSASQSGVMPEEQAASRILLQDMVHANDRGFVLAFDTRVYLLQDLTNSLPRLDAALERIRIGRSTSLWDAIFLACRSRMAQQTGRKVIVVMSDGGENSSEYTNKDAERLALDTNTILFFVDISDVGGSSGPGPGQLEKIAKDTGGRRLNGNNKKLAAAFAQIEATLRHQYTLAYKSDRPQHDGSFRRVEIETPGRKHLTLRARLGYTMPAG